MAGAHAEGGVSEIGAMERHETDKLNVHPDVEFCSPAGPECDI